MDAMEFYRLRDDRTNSCVGRAPFANAKVALSIDAQAAESLAGQVAFLLTANLTSRWCRAIRVMAPPTAVHGLLGFVQPGAADLGELTLRTMQAADPYGDFQAGLPDDEAWLCVHVGAKPSIASAFRIGAKGWLAVAGDQVGDDVLLNSERHGEVVAAILASCVGVAWAFRRAIGDTALPAGVRLSIWNLRGGLAATDGPASVHTDVGRLLLVGAGAVGSALAWILPLVGVRAEIAVVDGDLVEISNLNRSPLFAFTDVGMAKVDPVVAYLRRSGLRAEAVALWFDEAVRLQRILAVRPDVVVPAANERGVRHLMQHAVPPLQVYGTTGSDWQAFLGRHLPLVEDCLVCRFPSQVPAQPSLACATGNIATSAAEQPRDAALPFLSTAAAVLAVAELQKLALGAPLNPNFAVLDFRGPLHDFLVEQRSPRDRCVCRNQRKLWHRLNGNTAFAKLAASEA